MRQLHAQSGTTKTRHTLNTVGVSIYRTSRDRTKAADGRCGVSPRRHPRPSPSFRKTTLTWDLSSSCSAAAAACAAGTAAARTGYAAPCRKLPRAAAWTRPTAGPERPAASCCASCARTTSFARQLSCARARDAPVPAVCQTICYAWHPAIGDATISAAASPHAFGRRSQPMRHCSSALLPCGVAWPNAVAS